MLKLLLLTYLFAPGQTIHYDVTVGFDGYLPIMGGRQADVEVKMGVDVTGKEPDAEGRPQVVSEVKTAEISMNGAKMPFGLDNVKTYFPRTTVSLAPTGKVLATDAPDIEMPFRLPGLDIKRFPEITYVPIEFPETAVVEGAPFRFTRKFNGADMAYEVTPTSATDDRVEFALKIDQKADTFEDAKRQTVDEGDAVSKVTTSTTGAGTATFDLAHRRVTRLDLTATAESRVVNLKTNAESTRTLKIRVVTKMAL